MAANLVQYLESTSGSFFTTNRNITERFMAYNDIKAGEVIQISSGSTYVNADKVLHVKTVTGSAADAGLVIGFACETANSGSSVNVAVGGYFQGAFVDSTVVAIGDQLTALSGSANIAAAGDIAGRIFATVLTVPATSTVVMGTDGHASRRRADVLIHRKW